MMEAQTGERIGEVLLREGLITAAQLEQALERQRQTGERFGRALIELGFIEESSFFAVLSKQLAIPFVDLGKQNFDTALVQRLPETHARRYRAIVLSEREGVLVVGMADPTDLFAYDEISRILRAPIEVVLVRESELLATLDIVYRRTGEIVSYAGELHDEISGSQFIDLADVGTVATDSDAPVVKLLKSIFEDAVQIRASDIHIEPDETVLRIRQRVDGVLQEQVINEKRIGPALVLRLKLMAGLNISEKRLPQDGRFSLIVRKRKLDVRLSTMPVEYGESVVMRLLDQSDGVSALEDILPGSVLPHFRRIIRYPHGLILVTGPTGSGKTTTLYGALQELNDAGRKIITVEDPVEYRLPRVNQVQVHPQIGLTFARVLRAALRQDPDIILVGEIRDYETAEMALRAAMTGHLVLSTLHTNDAVSSALRLADMGAEGFLAAASLRAVLAQRLVRRLCDNCSVPYEPSARERGWLTHVLGDKGGDVVELRTAHGCYRCNNTGYSGRIGVFELLILDDAMSDALRHGDTAAFVAAARASATYQPLVLSALRYAVQGITTLEEIFRVAEQVDESPDFESPPRPAVPGDRH